MTDRIEAEVDILARAGWDVETDVEYRWIVVRGIPLGKGWSRRQADILIKIRPGYPTTPPDDFYAPADLRLANGNKPGNAPQEEVIDGHNWLMFSYHLEAGDWDPHADPEKGHNLLTYFDGVMKRLAVAN